MKGRCNNDILNHLTPKQKDCLTIDIAYFIIDNKSTIRKTAKRFKISKSTVHRYIHDRLPRLDFILYEKVLEILSINFKEKHVRGGQATKITKKGINKKVNK